MIDSLEDKVISSVFSYLMLSCQETVDRLKQSTLAKEPTKSSFCVSERPCLYDVFALSPTTCVCKGVPMNACTRRIVEPSSL